MNTTRSLPLRWYEGLTPYHWWVFCVGAVTLAGSYLLGLLVLRRAPETRGQPLIDE